MELEEKHEKLLLEIFEAKDQGLLNTSILEQPDSKSSAIEKMIAFLIKEELVEYDKNEAAFFLTYEGYEKVEEINALNEVGAAMANAEYEHRFNKGANFKLPLMILSLFLVLGIYFTVIGIRANQETLNIKNGLNPEIMEKIKDDIQYKIDSLSEEKQKKEMLLDN